MTVDTQKPKATPVMVKKTEAEFALKALAALHDDKLQHSFSIVVGKGRLQVMRIGTVETGDEGEAQ